MTKNRLIHTSLNITKSAKFKMLTNLLKYNPVQKAMNSRFVQKGITAKNYLGNKYRQLPGMARYGMGIAAGSYIPYQYYKGGKQEMESYIADKAYNDAYQLAQQRAGQEWANLPSWQRYAVATLGIQNALNLKNTFSPQVAGQVNSDPTQTQEGNPTNPNLPITPTTPKKPEPLSYSHESATGTTSYY